MGTDSKMILAGRPCVAHTAAPSALRAMCLNRVSPCEAGPRVVLGSKFGRRTLGRLLVHGGGPVFACIACIVCPQARPDPSVHLWMERKMRAGRSFLTQKARSRRQERCASKRGRGCQLRVRFCDLKASPGEGGAQWWSRYLACTRSWVQAPAPRFKKRAA